PSNSLYNFFWTNAPAGKFELHAEADGKTGAHGITDSAQIVVNSGGNTNPPPATNVVVALIRPMNGSSFAAGSSIQLTARATDSDGTVSYVDFFANAMNLGRVFTTPSNSLYNFFWTNAPAGNFELHAE